MKTVVRDRTSKVPAKSTPRTAFFVVDCQSTVGRVSPLKVRCEFRALCRDFAAAPTVSKRALLLAFGTARQGEQIWFGLC
jgi:hypothetical protein